MMNKIVSQQEAGRKTQKYCDWKTVTPISANELTEKRKKGNLIWFSEISFDSAGIVNYICSTIGNPENTFEIDISQSRKIQQITDSGLNGLVEIYQHEDGRRKGTIIMEEKPLNKPQQQYSTKHIETTHTSYDFREDLTGHFETYDYTEVKIKGRKPVKAIGMARELLTKENNEITVYYTIDPYLQRLLVSHIEFNREVKK